MQLSVQLSVLRTHWFKTSLHIAGFGGGSQGLGFVMQRTQLFRLKQRKTDKEQQSIAKLCAGMFGLGRAVYDELPPCPRGQFCDLTLAAVCENMAHCHDHCNFTSHVSNWLRSWTQEHVLALSHRKRLRVSLLDDPEGALALPVPSLAAPPIYRSPNS